MLNKIIHFSINNKLLIGIFTFILLVFGVFSFTQLPIDAVPDITNNQVQVITLSPTLSCEEIEKLITATVELNLANTPGIEEIRSVSRFGLSVVTIVFKESVDVYWARQQISERIDQIRSQIPKELGTPEMAPVTTGLGEIYQYIIKPTKGFENKYTLADLRTIQDWTIRKQLIGTEGIADVSGFGGFNKQYEVALDPIKMRSLNVSLTEIINSLQKNNQNTGGAYIEKNSKAYFIRGLGLLTNIDDINKIFIKNANTNTPILVRDVATVQIGNSLRYGAMTYNDEGETVGGIVLMLKGENSGHIIKKIKERINEIKNRLPEGIEIIPYLDRSKMVKNTIETVRSNLLEGALIVIFVLVIFLGNVRAGLIVASVIPLSLLFAISVMYLTGASGNLMSLGAIDFGLIVDGAVIIVEAAIHGLGLRKNQKLTQEQMNEAIFTSTTKMMNSASFGQIIILIVYLPILTLTGIEGKMFKPMAETIIYAITGAFILSITYVPMINSLFLNKNIVHKKSISDKMIDFLKIVYKPILLFSLRNKLTVLITTFITLLISLYFFSKLGGEFIPTLDEGDFAIESKIMLGSSLKQSIETATKAATILRSKFPEVEQVVSKIGTSEIPTDPMPFESFDLIINLKPKDKWVSAKSKTELVDKMSNELSCIVGVNFGFQQPVQMRFNELMSGGRQDVGLKIFGEDLDKLTMISQKIETLISKINGVEDIYLEQNYGLPQIKININRDNLARYGFSVEDVSKAVQASYAGENVGLIYEGEKRFELSVRLKEEFRNNIENIGNLFITNSSGIQVPINQLANIEITTGRNQIQREEAKRKLSVGFNVRRRDIETVVNEVQQKLKKDLVLPNGYFIKYGGDFENLIKAKERLMLAVPAALFLIFSLLYLTLKSVKQSIMILSAIPLASIGGILSLTLRGMPFSISAGVGFIALFGIAVLNGIVLISEFNTLRSNGMENMNGIIIRGTFLRLRPVLMTALVASLGFLPMALSNGAGAEVQKPLATVVIGGLISSTLLTLLVLPILYTLIETNKVKQSKNIGIISVLLLLILSNSLKAEQFTEAKCIEIALSKNKQINLINLELEKQITSSYTSFDFGKTYLAYQFGKINDLNDDNGVKLSQTIPFITKLYARLDYFEAKKELVLAQKRALINEIEFNVRIALKNIEYYSDLDKLYKKQEVIYSNILNSVQSKYNYGENNSLDLSLAKTQLEEIKIKLISNHSDFEITKQKLFYILNTQLNEDIDFENSKIIQIEDTLLNIKRLENNLSIKVNQSENKIKQSLLNIEKKEILPDFNLNISNQTFNSISTNQRFNNFEVGISLPIIYNAQNARNEIADIDLKMTEIQNEYNKYSLENHLNQLIIDYKRFKNVYDKTNNTLILFANEFEDKSNVAYSNGEISFIDYQMSLTKSFTYKETQVNNIYKINLIALEIQQLLNLK